MTSYASDKAVRPLRSCGCRLLARRLPDRLTERSCADRPVSRPDAGEPVPAPPRFLATPRHPTGERPEGFYVGGQLGITGAGIDFGNGTAPLTNYIFATTWSARMWPIGSPCRRQTATSRATADLSATTAQWDGNLILGVEANYNRIVSGGLGDSAANSITWAFNDNSQAPAGHHYTYTATVDSSATARMQRLCHHARPRRVRYGSVYALCLCRRGARPGRRRPQCDRSLQPPRHS